MCVPSFIEMEGMGIDGYTLGFIPYSGKFSHGDNYCIFRMRVLHAKIKTTKISTIKIFA